LWQIISIKKKRRKKMNILSFLLIISLIDLMFGLSISQVCSNRPSSNLDLDLLDLSTKCNYFYESNTNYDEDYIENSDLNLIETSSASNITECCDICFQSNSCTLFRFLKLTQKCDFFAPKSNNYAFQIYDNECYDLGLVIGK
jgi:hypothetical protein